MSTREQSVELWRRAKRRKAINPEYRLGYDYRFEFTDDDNPILTTVFDNRRDPLTVALTVTRDDTTSNGVLFEFGGGTRGIAAWLNGASLGWCAGTSTGSTGVAVTCANALPTLDKQYRCVFSVVPGNGKIRVWVDGRLVGIAGASDFGANGWGAGGNGAIGRVEGAINTLVPAPQRVTLADATIHGSVSFYDGGYPQVGSW